jgi:hypothetical protein
MNSRINDIVNRIKAMQIELEIELEKAREHLNYQLVGSKVQFDRGVRELHKRYKASLIPYILFPKWRHVVVAPFIYTVVPVLLLLDLMVSLYHAVCFPLLGIPKVRRSDYFVYDRSHLAYLNLLEMLNCAYCSYGNGLISYVKEIVGRTEQYWCPIRHARRVLDAHSHYANFLDYGDAEAYRKELERLRQFKE